MPKYTRILCLDGGRIRGIILGQVLVNLERFLTAKAGKDTRLADCFDLIAGISTGGILTCAYLLPDTENPRRPKYTAEQAVDIYFFEPVVPSSTFLLHWVNTASGLSHEMYSSAGIDTALDDYIGETPLSQLLRPCDVATGEREPGVMSTLWSAFDTDRLRAKSVTRALALLMNVDHIDAPAFEVATGVTLRRATEVEAKEFRRASSSCLDSRSRRTAGTLTRSSPKRRPPMAAGPICWPIEGTSQRYHVVEVAGGFPVLAQTTDCFYVRSDDPASGRKLGIIVGRLFEAVCRPSFRKIQVIADAYDECHRKCFSMLGIVAYV